MFAESAVVSDTFPTGEEYIVDMIEEVRGVGRRLHFVLPSGKAVWVNLGDEGDTPERRNMIAAHLKAGDRYIKGERIGPF